MIPLEPLRGKCEPSRSYFMDVPRVRFRAKGVGWSLLPMLERALHQSSLQGKSWGPRWAGTWLDLTGLLISCPHFAKALLQTKTVFLLGVLAVPSPSRLPFVFSVLFLLFINRSFLSSVKQSSACL